GVPRQRLEHVVEEPDPGACPSIAHPVERHSDAEVGLLGLTMDFRGTRHRESVNGHAVVRIISSAETTASMSSPVPTEIRKQSFSSGAAETSRTRIPKSASRRRKTSLAGTALKRINRKFAAEGYTVMPRIARSRSIVRSRVAMMSAT